MLTGDSLEFPTALRFSSFSPFQNANGHRSGGHIIFVSALFNFSG